MLIQYWFEILVWSFKPAILKQWFDKNLFNIPTKLGQYPAKSVFPSGFSSFQIFRISKHCLFKAEKEGLELTGFLFEQSEPTRNMSPNPPGYFSFFPMHR